MTAQPESAPDADSLKDPRSTHWMLALGLCVAVGSAPRLWNLNTWPLYGDEVSTALASGAAFSWDNLRPLAFAFNHYVALPLLGESEVAYRIAPAATGIAFIPVIALVVRRWYGEAAGLFAALVAALSPVLLNHSQFARYYMQAILLTTLLVLVARAAVQEGRAWQWAGAVALFLTGWFTVQSTSFVLPGVALWMLWNWRSLRLTTVLVALRRQPLAAAVLGLTAVVLGRWLVARMTGAPGESLATDVRYYSAAGLVLALTNAFTLPIAIAAVAGAVLCWTDEALSTIDRTFLPLVTLGSLATFAAAFPFLAVGPGHVLSAVAPWVVALAGYLLSRIHAAVSPRWLGLAVALVISLSTAREIASHMVDGGRPDYRMAIDVVRRHVPGTPLVYATSHGVIAYYAPDLGARELLPMPDSLRWLSDPARPTAFAIVAENRRGPEIPERLLGADEWPPVCRLIARFERPRFDFSLAATRVYECPTPARRP